MESSQEIVRSIVIIWTMCKKQERMFKHAMCLEGSLQSRKTFCLGYIISLVFRNELRTAYDELKCNLTDPDLNDLFDNREIHLITEDLMHCRLVCQHLNDITLKCKRLTRHVDLRDCETKILTEFVYISQKLTFEMEKHLGKTELVPVKLFPEFIRSDGYTDLLNGISFSSFIGFSLFEEKSP